MEKEDRIRQKEQRKELSPAEKWQYFIDYYLWITIGVAAGIAVVIFLIVHFATKTSFVMGVMAVNTDGEHIEATGPDYFTDFLREHGVTSKRDVVNLNYTIWIDPNSDSDVDSTNLSTIHGRHGLSGGPAGLSAGGTAGPIRGSADHGAHHDGRNDCGRDPAGEQRMGKEDRMVSGDRSRGAGGWHEESGAGSGTVGGDPTVVPSRLPAPAADDALWERG